MDIIIRPAKPQEANILTLLARYSNGGWRYPEEYHEKWDRKLEVPPSEFTQNMVCVSAQGDEIIGYYSIVHIHSDYRIRNRYMNKGYWLKILFVLPEYIRKGFGTTLLEHAKILCRENDGKELYVFVKPNLKGFYDKMGGQLIRQSPTEYLGNTIPVYLLPIK